MEGQVHCRSEDWGLRSFEYLSLPICVRYAELPPRAGSSLYLGPRRREMAFAKDLAGAGPIATTSCGFRWIGTSILASDCDSLCLWTKFVTSD